MKIIPDVPFADALNKVGRADLVKGFEIDDAEFHRLLKEARRSHPNDSAAERVRWAAYSAYTLHEKKRPVSLAAKTKKRAASLFVPVCHAVIVLLLLIIILDNHC